MWRSVCARSDVRVDVSNELTGSCLSTFVRLCAAFVVAVCRRRSVCKQLDPARLIGWR